MGAASQHRFGADSVTPKRRHSTRIQIPLSSGDAFPVSKSRSNSSGLKPSHASTRLPNVGYRKIVGMLAEGVWAEVMVNGEHLRLFSEHMRNALEWKRARSRWDWSFSGARVSELESLKK
jgi:hypothetical protein